jgi:uncharacterized protein involved in exopolysaccharide biosynthesis
MAIITKKDIVTLRNDAAKLFYYVRVVFKEWRTVLVFMLLGLAGSMIYLHRVPVTYTAKMVLIATQPQDQLPSSVLGQFASYMNITSVNQSATAFTLYPGTLASETVADEIIRTHPETLQRLFSWDEKNNTWRRPGRLHEITDRIKLALGIPVIPWQEPNAAQLREVIQSRVSIAVDPRRPIITLSLDSADPQFAKTLLDQINSATDNTIKKWTLDRSSKYGKYLETKLAAVQANDLRQTLITSYSQQITQMMLSGSNAPFAAQPLGGANASLAPTQPRAIQALLMGILFGTAVGAIDALFRLQILQRLFRMLASVRLGSFIGEPKFAKPRRLPPD